MVELIAPGPAIKGSANGTTPILSRTAVSVFPACLLILAKLTADHRHRNTDDQNSASNPE